MRPIIAGSDIKASQVAREAQRMAMALDDILDPHPHLTASQVHAALAYYEAYRSETHAELAKVDDLFQRLEREYR